MQIRCWNCDKSLIWCSEEDFRKQVVYLQYKPLREMGFCSEKCLDKYLKEKRKD